MSFDNMHLKMFRENIQKVKDGNFDAIAHFIESIEQRVSNAETAIIVDEKKRAAIKISPSRTFKIKELVVIRTALLLLQHEVDPSSAKPVMAFADIYSDCLSELSEWSINAQKTASKFKDVSQ